MSRTMQTTIGMLLLALTACGGSGGGAADRVTPRQAPVATSTTTTIPYAPTECTGGPEQPAACTEGPGEQLPTSR